MKTELDLHKEWCKENTTRNLYEGICLAIDNYQKANSEASGEARTVDNNECQEELCCECGENEVEDDGKCSDCLLDEWM